MKTKMILCEEKGKKNDLVSGLKGHVNSKENGKKVVEVSFKLKNNLGYDGCGTHTHQ